jgi:single-strand DNA-binding protein
MDNSVDIVGNFVKAPELTFTGAGVARCVFSVASSRRITKRDGTTSENTVYFDVICWRELAEHVAESCDKGTRVAVSGELIQRSWTTDDGQKRSKMELSAQEVSISLRFATAVVTKVGRSDGAGPARQAQPVGASNGASRPSASEPNYDEPF